MKFRFAIVHFHRHAQGTVGAPQRSFGYSQRVSGVAVSTESHVAIHTWPEHQYAAIDIFSCGESLNHKIIGRELCRMLRRLLKYLTRESHPERSGEERVAKSKDPDLIRRLRIELEVWPRISENRGRMRRRLLDGILRLRCARLATFTPLRMTRFRWSQYFNRLLGRQSAALKWGSGDVGYNQRVFENRNG